MDIFITQYISENRIEAIHKLINDGQLNKANYKGSVNKLKREIDNAKNTNK